MTISQRLNLPKRQDVHKVNRRPSCPKKLSTSLTPNLSGLLPRSPHSNQAAHSPGKTDNAVIKIGIPKSRARDGKIAEIGDELQVRSIPFPFVIYQHT